MPRDSLYLLDNVEFMCNLLIGYNHRQLAIIELDNEAKDDNESLFYQRSELHDTLRVAAFESLKP